MTLAEVPGVEVEVYLSQKHYDSAESQQLRRYNLTSGLDMEGVEAEGVRRVVPPLPPFSTPVLNPDSTHYSSCSQIFCCWSGSLVWDFGVAHLPSLEVFLQSLVSSTNPL